MPEQARGFVSTEKFPLYSLIRSGEFSVPAGLTDKQGEDRIRESLSERIGGAPPLSLFLIENSRFVYGSNYRQMTGFEAFRSLPCLPPFEKLWIEYSDYTGYPQACFVYRSIEAVGWCFYPVNAHWGNQGELYLMPRMLVTGFNEQGGLALDTLKVLRLSEATNSKDVAPEEHDAYLKYALGVFAETLNALSLMHCKNIRIAERFPKRHEQREAKRRGEPILKYHEIVIDPNRSYVTNDTSASNGNKPSKALHIARGHFAHYTEEKKLFGKYAGTFWVPAHVRGRADNGEVRSTYRVKGGEQ